jgi:hypothetical protein
VKSSHVNPPDIGRLSLSANIIRVHTRAMLISIWVIGYSNELTRRFHQQTKALMREYHEMFSMEYKTAYQGIHFPHLWL